MTATKRNEEPIIQVKNISKQYNIGMDRTYKTFSESFTNAIRSPIKSLNSIRSQQDTFWALKDINFEVEQGEVVGIIGRNGAGKSTLLKILSRITTPTEGEIRLKGRVGSLLEVGTGFHPELTGRENIYFNGAILGMKKKEIDDKFDEIVKFSGVEKFLDTPVKRYSSGMQVRLAFSVAANLDPEILVVDEVLAVGDAAFQKKCLGKMGEVAEGGRTVLFVSHNMGAVNKLCTSCILLNSGKIQLIGHPNDIINQYLDNLSQKSSQKRFSPNNEYKGQIFQVALMDDEGNVTSDFPSHIDPTLEIKYILNEKVIGFHVACIISNQDGYHIFSTADTDLNPNLFDERPPGNYCVRVKLPTKWLNTGTYNVAVGIGIAGVETYDRQDAVAFTKHDTGDFGTAKEGSRRAGLLLIDTPWYYIP